MAKQRQGWSATLRTIASDLAQRLDGYVSAHATQIADAARSALPAIRELQARPTQILYREKGYVDHVN